jgi:hypothetical protein
MELKRITKGLMFAFVVIVSLNSCYMDSKQFVNSVRNCTSDTLLIELTESGNFDGRSIFDDKDTSDYTGVDFEYVTEAYIKGKKVYVSKYNYALPDSTTLGKIVVDNRKKYYLYAVKWSVATHYTLDEIRAKKLYDRRVVTKKDFNDYVYEYK